MTTFVQYWRYLRLSSLFKTQVIFVKNKYYMLTIT